MLTSISYMVLGLMVSRAHGISEFPDCVNGPLASNKVCDPSVPAAERAAALVAAMTLQEKMVNLVEYGSW
jgi:hypothetical protein